MTLSCRILLCLAGLCGAAGVALSAVSAHVAGGAMLSTGASFLLLHAAATVGAVALVSRTAGAAAALLTISAAAMLAGAALFCGDLALRALMGTKLLWGTAPTGGTLAILGWLGLAVAAFLRTGDTTGRGYAPRWRAEDRSGLGGENGGRTWD